MARFSSLACRRARRIVSALLLALIGVATSQARLPYPDRIPTGAIAVLGIADTGKFWAKADALPLTAGIKQYLDSPQLTQDQDYQQFVLERRKMEATLGYPVTPAELLQNVFKDVLIYSVPATGKQPIVVIVLGVRDAKKAAKLITALDNKNKELAAADAASTATLAKATFEKVTIDGVEASHIRKTGEDAGAAVDNFYALAGGRLVYASDRALFSGLLKPEAPAPALAQNPEFTRLSGLLPWGEADFQGWVDGDAIVQNGGMGAMMNGMAGVPKDNKVAFTFQLLPDGLLGKTASSADHDRSPQLKAGQLDGMSQVPQNPLFALAYGMLDAPAAYTQLSNLMGLAAASGQFGAQQPGASPFAAFEQQTGISVLNELVPAVGQQAILSLNNMQFNPMQMPPIPTLDLTIGLQVRDAAKMKAVMDKFEKFLEQQTAQMAPPAAGADGAPAAASKFKTVAGTPVRSLSLNFPGLSPSYAFQGKFVLIGLNAESVQAALGRVGGKQPSMANAPAFAELKKIAGTDQLESFIVADIGRLVNSVLLPAFPFIAAKMPPAGQQQALAVMQQIASRIGTVAAAETQRQGAAVGYVRIKMQ